MLPAMFIAAALFGSVVGPSAAAQDGAAAPTYSRMRMGADDWNARGGRWFPGGYGGYGCTDPATGAAVGAVAGGTLGGVIAGTDGHRNNTGAGIAIGGALGAVLGGVAASGRC